MENEGSHKESCEFARLTSQKSPKFGNRGSPNPVYIPHRTFEFSSDVFGGFRAYVDIRREGTLDDIVSSAVSQLCQSFQKLGLRELVRRVCQTQFHSHDVTMAGILVSPPEKVYYICDHCGPR